MNSTMLSALWHHKKAWNYLVGADEGKVKLAQRLRTLNTHYVRATATGSTRIPQWAIDITEQIDLLMSGDSDTAASSARIASSAEPTTRVASSAESTDTSAAVHPVDPSDKPAKHPRLTRRVAKKPAVHDEAAAAEASAGPPAKKSKASKAFDARSAEAESPCDSSRATSPARSSVSVAHPISMATNKMACAEPPSCHGFDLCAVMPRSRFENDEVDLRGVPSWYPPRRYPPPSHAAQRALTDVPAEPSRAQLSDSIAHVPADPTGDSSESKASLPEAVSASAASSSSIEPVAAAVAKAAPFPAPFIVNSGFNNRRGAFVEFNDGMREFTMELSILGEDVVGSFLIDGHNQDHVIQGLHPDMLPSAMAVVVPKYGQLASRLHDVEVTGVMH